MTSWSNEDKDATCKDDKEPFNNKYMIIKVKAADKDGTGFLTAEELKEMLLSFGPEQGWVPNDKCIEMLGKMCSSYGSKKQWKLEVVEAIN